MRLFVVITGLPASGKSTIGRAIASELAWPFFDKDQFLESLFQATVTNEAAERHVLSRIADESFRASAFASAGAVLATWWRHPRSFKESGTSPEWLSSCFVVEVYCSCPPLVAVERFMARTRHPGHLDRMRSRGQLLTQFTEQSSLGPLGLGPLIEVNTTSALEVPAILEQINHAFATLRHSQPAA
jgi:Shikimate kinase